MAIMAMPAPARAQAQPPGQSQAATAVQDLSDIVVTARFRSESVQNAPVAITALSGATLGSRNITSVENLGSAVPNAFIAPPTGAAGPAPLISMRGIYQSDFNYAFEPGGGVYIDDVYHSTLTGSDLDLVDLDRVEVLRGPQGTLFGKNSMGGAIRLFSKAPSGGNTGYVEGGYGNFSHYELKAGFDTPILADKLFVRVSGVAKHERGYVDLIDFGCRMVKNGTPNLIPAGIVANDKLGSSCKVGREGGQDLKAGRVFLRWVASPELEVNLIADITRDDRDANPDVLIGVVPADQLPPLVPSVAPWNGNIANGPTPVYDARFVPTKRYESFANITTGNKSYNHEWGVSLAPTYHISDDMQAKLIVAYRRANSDFSYNPDASPYGFGENSNPTTHRQFSTELQLSGTLLDKALEWTAGGYYFRGTTHLGGHIIYSTLNFDQDDRYGETDGSGFLHAIYHFTDKLSITGGGRYSYVKKSFVFHHPGITDDSFRNVAKAKRVDWLANVNYEFSPDLNVYAQAATGFRPGGVNPRPLVIPDQLVPFKGENLISYEGGVKMRLLDRKATVNLAGFYSDYKSHLSSSTIFECLDSKAPAFTPASCAGASAPWFFYFNDKARIYGAEAELTLRPVAGLNLNASVGWNHGESLVKDRSAPNYRDPSNLFQPAWNASAGAEYTADLPIGGTLTPRIDWLYQSKMTFTANLGAPATPLVTADGRSTFNGRLTYALPANDWSVSLAVTNMFDKYFFYNKFTQNGLAISGVPSRPREWFFSISKKF
ncbi:TonB-dependent receptor [Sphingomonas sp. MMS24-J13]|uniref:TonB-dependent receptor n=1 Tax=Sphingomonas sp. MMS24-J13 TaxID=3238686 RepID=UPI00384CCFAC